MNSKASKNEYSLFQRIADQPVEDTESSTGYEKLNFYVASRPFAKAKYDDVCLNCILPTCIKDVDYKCEMKQAGIDRPHSVFCPIYLVAAVSDSSTELKISMKQAQNICYIGFHRNYTPQWILNMAAQDIERNKLKPIG